jgi:DNA-binding beta-propeller fold protein YncE
MVFGPNGKTDGSLDLYVAEVFQGSVARYDGTTGAFKENFVSSNAGGLVNPGGIVFGPDGNLYVANTNLVRAPGSVLRYQGPNGPKPGAFIDTFIPGGSGGLAQPYGLLFGPDGRNDGKLDLYVADMQLFWKNGLQSVPGTSQILRYDGTTGAFKGVFVTPDSGGLRLPTFMTFTETNPTTLNFNGR